ncbi:VapC toxin family PIN domain ribonuclease [Thioalkalivibrio denitrificans]|uniref:Ribonuclease VapC n=1 Tax=Thioalkalivibrio denitrificans TaxID=108003 RepID=A0A1V3NI81_9GAMM|nr:type II toxin-antitoxin system VapC family toxin [Thioalkalivibrio denitrificans]OOG24809.1 VapC toxin family PIN domain ribonuclease [Thioalkalivibrio denitrificans]
MIILDTNVLSELMRASPDEGVVRWLAAQPASSLYTTTVAQAEILYGVCLLPDGRRRDGLMTAVEDMFAVDFRGRILPFDSDAAHAYARIAVGRRQAGRPISQFDAQIAGIALSRDAGVATRNVTDFEGCGVRLYNPWAGE